MSKAKKIAVILLSVATVIVIACGIVFYQVPFDYDLSSISPLPNDVQLLAADHPLNNSGSPALAKIKNGAISNEPFRILFLTDVHLCELQSSTRETIERFVKWVYSEKPDLIILGGDTLNGLNDSVRVLQFRYLMDRLGVYWAPVLGNHEGDRDFLMTSREDVVKCWSKSPRCLMESDTKKTADGRTVDGYGNYVLSVLGADGLITDSFFFLDNGSKLMEEKEYKKWGVNKKADTAISQAQVDWYQETYAAMKEKNGGTLTHMCVIHKPLQELAAAIEITGEIDYGKEVTWHFTDQATADGWTLIDGTLRDKIHCPPYQDGALYSALVTNGAKAMFFGHDHVNDLTVYNTHDDIYLTYIRLTTVTERVADAEGYNILSLYPNGSYDYRAYKTSGALDAILFTD